MAAYAADSTPAIQELHSQFDDADEFAPTPAPTPGASPSFAFSEPSVEESNPFAADSQPQPETVAAEPQLDQDPFGAEEGGDFLEPTDANAFTDDDDWEAATGLSGFGEPTNRARSR